MVSGRRKKLICLLLLLFGAPYLAYANAGTALMWGVFLHLFIGNFFIGLLEGTLLALPTKKGYAKCIGLMLLANYFSAWVGLIGTEYLGNSGTLSWSLYNVRALMLLLAFLYWLATVLLEWPFIWLTQQKGARRWLPALKKSLIVQTVSYLLLVAWYLLCGNYSLLTQCTSVQPDEFTLAEKICIYYVADDDGHVYGLRPGEKPFKVAELPSDETPYQLICERSAPEAATATLKAIRFKKHYTDKVVQIVDVLPDFAPADRVLLEPDREKADEAYPDRSMDDDKPYIDASWYWVGRPLGAARDSSIRFSSGFWAAQGLRLLTKVERPRGRRPSPDRYGFDWGEWETTRRLFALETPFLAWRVRDIIQLPDDVVLLRLGDQLCLFDYRTMRIALLARGRSATAVLEQ